MKILLLLTALLCSINTGLMAGATLTLVEELLGFPLTFKFVNKEEKNTGKETVNVITAVHAIDEATGRRIIIRYRKKELLLEQSVNSGIFECIALINNKTKLHPTPRLWTWKKQ